MPQCVTIRAKHRNVCAGDMDRRIEIYSRYIQSPLDETDMMHDQEYTLKASPWAIVQTLRGITTFDGIEISGIEALEVYIRYNPSITSEDFVRIDGKNIRIRSVEDLDRRKEFMRLVCIEEGMASNKASL